MTPMSGGAPGSQPGSNDEDVFAAAAAGAAALNAVWNQESWAVNFLENTRQFGVQLICAGGSGAIAKTAVAPLERAKILAQVQSMSLRAPEHRYRGPWDALWRMRKAEGGWRVLFRGNGANVIRLVPEVGFKFAVHDQFTVMFSPPDGSPMGVKEKMAAGAATGVCKTLLFYPLDFCRTRITAYTTFVTPAASSGPPTTDLRPLQPPTNGQRPLEAGRQPGNSFTSASSSAESAANARRQLWTRAAAGSSLSSGASIEAVGRASRMGGSSAIGSSLAGLGSAKMATHPAAAAAHGVMQQQQQQQQQQLQQQRRLAQGGVQPPLQSAVRRAAAEGSLIRPQPMATAAAGTAASGGLEAACSGQGAAGAGAAARSAAYAGVHAAARNAAVGGLGAGQFGAHGGCLVVATASSSSNSSSNWSSSRSSTGGFSSSGGGGSSSGGSSGGSSGSGSGLRTIQRGMHSASAAAAAPSGRPQVPGVFATLHNAVTREGLLSVYKGMLPSLPGVMFYTSMSFTAYDYLKHLLPSDKNSKEAWWFPFAKMGCGAAAGIAAQTLSYPLDTIRRRMQMVGAPGMVGSPEQAAAAAAASAEAAGGGGARVRAPRIGYMALYRMMKREKGGVLRGLFRGWSINCVKIVPGAAVQFLAYDLLRVGVTWVDPTSGAQSPL